MTSRARTSGIEVRRRPIRAALTDSRLHPLDELARRGESRAHAVDTEDRVSDAGLSRISVESFVGLCAELSCRACTALRCIAKSSPAPGSFAMPTPSELSLFEAFAYDNILLMCPEMVFSLHTSLLMTNALGIVWKVAASKPSLASDVNLHPLEESEQELPTQDKLARGTATINLVEQGRQSSVALACIANADAIAPFLLTSPLLLSLNTTQVRHLCDVGKLLFVEAGETIYRNHEESAVVYLVVDGTLDVQSAHGYFRQPGELVGEFAILSDARRFGSVRAVSDAALLEIPAMLLRNFFGMSKAALGRLSHILTEELATTALAQSRLCDGLQIEGLRSLAKHCAFESFVCGDFVDKPGADSEGIYLVISGRLTAAEFYGECEVATEFLGEGVAFRLARRNEARALRAESDGWLLRLDRQGIDEMVAITPTARGAFMDFV